MQQVSMQQVSTQQSYEPMMKTDHNKREQQKDKVKPKFDRNVLRQVKRNQIEVLKKFH
jgi:hypothetical protein